MERIKQAVVLAVVGSALWVSATACNAHLVVIVSAKSPLTTLTRKDVADIYLGRTNEFPRGAPIVPIDQAEDNAQRTEFYWLVTGKSPAQVRTYWSKLIFTGRGEPPRSEDNAEAVKRAVSGWANAVGYIDQGELDPRVKAVLILQP